jgi:hypothetical protein
VCLWSCVFEAISKEVTRNEVEPSRQALPRSRQGWGAIYAGCAAAFVARPGMVLNPLFERPDVVGSDLREVTDEILNVET